MCVVFHDHDLTHNRAKSRVRICADGLIWGREDDMAPSGNADKRRVDVRTSDSRGSERVSGCRPCQSRERRVRRAGGRWPHHWHRLPCALEHPGRPSLGTRRRQTTTCAQLWLLRQEEAIWHTHANKTDGVRAVGQGEGGGQDMQHVSLTLRAHRSWRLKHHAKMLVGATEVRGPAAAH